LKQTTAQASRTNANHASNLDPTGPAAAASSSGTTATAPPAGIAGYYDEDVYIFEPGGTTPIDTYEFGHLPNQETWAHTLVDGGLAWHGDRIYAITEQLSEPDNVTLRIRDLGQ
jgi:hypothetical protein